MLHDKESVDVAHAESRILRFYSSQILRMCQEILKPIPTWRLHVCTGNKAAIYYTKYIECCWTSVLFLCILCL